MASGADVNAKTGGAHVYPLQTAASRGHEENLRLLLDRGANINAQSGYSRTALVAAVEGNHESAVQLLLGRGADIHIKIAYGDALLYASVNGNERLV